MPRFLDTHTGEFVWLTEVGTTPYAILSHTWRSAEDGGEQTYDDILILQSSIRTPMPGQSRETPSIPQAGTIFAHRKLSAKIRGICEVARNAGYRLIWIDSCCIDKRSSAELTEAINSMYALYRDATVCYVYLSDVRNGEDTRHWDSPFRTSRWHKRGWTLQELIAPKRVVFLSRRWTFLDTKMGLASTLENITGVDASILMGRKELSCVSVAKRMSWAVGRETTRIEDRAYSLLGIFGVHMSPIYGEGTNSFLRLQEEIIKHIPDQSIFAWGLSSLVSSLSPDVYSFKLSYGSYSYTQPGLLAHSPDAFKLVGDITPFSTSDFATRIGAPGDFAPPPLLCTFTPQGIRLTLTVIPLASVPQKFQPFFDDEYGQCLHEECRKYKARSPTRALALLRCLDRDGCLVALPLTCFGEDVSRAENVAVGIRTKCPPGSGHYSTRVLRLSSRVLEELGVMPTCVDVSILRHFEDPLEPRTHRQGFSRATRITVWDLQSVSARSVFRLSPDTEEDLHAVGYTVTPLDCQWIPRTGRGEEDIILTTTLKCAQASSPPELDYRTQNPPYAWIQLLLTGKYHDNVTARFSIHCGDGYAVHGSSTPTDNGRRQSSSTSTFDAESSACLLAEAEFMLSERTDVPPPDMRLLRLKLERPLHSAYVEDGSTFLFSVELSDAFKLDDEPEVTAPTAATSSTPEKSFTEQRLSECIPGGSTGVTQAADADSQEDPISELIRATLVDGSAPQIAQPAQMANEDIHRTSSNLAALAAETQPFADPSQVAIATPDESRNPLSHTGDSPNSARVSFSPSLYLLRAH